MPMMNYRVVQPEHLIDLGRIPELASVEDTPEGLKVGAMTTQRTLERSALVRQRCPLLIDALFHIGHQQTRNRGTIGGSICHLDPSAELPVTACALDAVMTVASKSGRRKIPFARFPAGYLTSSLEPDEILVQIDFGSWPKRTGSAFEEYAVRPADFAIVSIAAVVVMDGSDIISKARIAAGGVAAVPTRLTAVETMLQGQRADVHLIERAAAMAAALPAEGDDNNPPEYRQELTGYLTQRALTKAVQRAGT
jgi:carbon-monoxide dehydrogenase medium subunit